MPPPPIFFVYAGLPGFDDDLPEGEGENKQETETLAAIEWNFEAPEQHVGVWKLLVECLRTGKHSPQATSEDKRVIKRLKHLFELRNGTLLKRSKGRGEFVVLSRDSRIHEALFQFHEGLVHRGRNSMFSQLSKPLWWPNMWESVVGHVRSCESCQKRSTQREHEISSSSRVSRLFQKVHLDIVDLSRGLEPRT